MERNRRHCQKNWWTWVNIHGWPYLYSNWWKIAISLDKEEIKHVLIHMASKTENLIKAKWSKKEPGTPLLSILITRHPVSNSVRIPRLSRNDCLVQESLHLCFNFKVRNTKNHLKNNLAKMSAEHIYQRDYIQQPEWKCLWDIQGQMAKQVGQILFN